MEPDFDSVRSKCPTQEALRLMAEAARDEASAIAMKKAGASWDVEAGAWMRLAEAAYVCETILVRRHLSFIQGVPEREGGAG